MKTPIGVLNFLVLQGSRLKFETNGFKIITIPQEILKMLVYIQKIKLEIRVQNTDNKINLKFWSLNSEKFEVLKLKFHKTSNYRSFEMLKHFQEPGSSPSTFIKTNGRFWNFQKFKTSKFCGLRGVSTKRLTLLIQFLQNLDRQVFHKMS